jgi:hypothetical protein
MPKVSSSQARPTGTLRPPVSLAFLHKCCEHAALWRLALRRPQWPISVALSRLVDEPGSHAKLCISNLRSTCLDFSFSLRRCSSR